MMIVRDLQRELPTTRTQDTIIETIALILGHMGEKPVHPGGTISLEEI